MRPLIRNGDQFVESSWKDALIKIGQELSKRQGHELTAVAGQLSDVESMVALKDLFTRLGSDNFRLDGGLLHSGVPAHGVDFRSNYLFNVGIANVERADALLLVGTNPRHEGAIVNTRIRKNWLRYTLDVALIGQPVDLTYDYDHLGTDVSALASFEKHPFFKRFSSAKNPMVIVGSGVVEHAGAAQVYAHLSKLAKKVPSLITPEWRGVNVLQRHASVAGALDIGFVPGAHATPLAESKFFYLLGADQISETDIPKDAFVVYQGHHGDAGAHLADVVLPAAAYTEKSAVFVNTEGRSQITRQAVTPPGDGREDWTIIRALSEVVGHTLPYDDSYSLHDRMAEYAPHLVRFGAVEPSSFAQLALTESTTAKKSSTAAQQPFDNVIKNFYMTDPISRASSTMAKCTVSFVQPKLSAAADEGEAMRQNA